MKKLYFEKLLSLFLVIAILLSLSVLRIGADSSNGQSEGGQTGQARTCFYLQQEYGWRVSIYVAKDIGYDEKTYKSMSLEKDYYYCGSVDISNIPKEKDISKVSFGQKSKVEYLKDPNVILSNTGYSYLSYKECPPIPNVSQNDYGVFFTNIDEVNATFRKNTMILSLLEEIASRKGASNAFDLVKNRKFTNHYTDADGNRLYQTRTGAEWGESRILPTNGRMNLVPWVIIYEPMALVYEQGGRPLAFLTATEFALTQAVDYNWLWEGSEIYANTTWGGRPYTTGGLPGRAVMSLAFNALPGSVTLEENWFGFASSPVAPGGFWTVGEIWKFGGWGMGFLSASKSIEMTYVNPGCEFIPGREVVTSFILKNRSALDFLPEENLRVYLQATTDTAGYGGEPKMVSICNAVSDPVVLPAGEDTYVWFRWTVPENMNHGIHLMADFAFGDETAYSGTALLHEMLDGTFWPDESHTPEPTFETRPSWFYLEGIDQTTQTGTWHTWTYDEESGEYSRCEWRATLDGSATLTPDSRAESSEYYPETNTWAMRSGYGISCEARSAVTVTADGKTTDPNGRNTAEAAVPAELGKVRFPEFLWSPEYNEYELAEYMETSRKPGVAEAQFCLPENPDGRYNRVHFTPLWFPDGFAIYRMAIDWEACWTPAGTLEARTVSDGITIDGDLYDDWYIVHH